MQMTMDLTSDHRTEPDRGTWRCLTIVEAAAYLSLSRSALYVLLERGELPSIRIGRSRRIPLAELERFVRSRVTAGW